ncbi:MAG: A/G-specific adenine glycosylase [Lachnospiraceae bacterium]|nr:A/G-specific adenine glycosylase [Lachnospiraceae bacterium]
METENSTAAGRDFSERLLNWYDSKRRILPWREDPSPYHVWLSEIMLQQTRVETVISYYQRFLFVLPDLEHFAAAEEQVYMKLWEGLGYYSRIRNFHKAAVQVVEEYDGKVPSDPAVLKKLPGIGPYTAAAIASIAYGVRAVSVDGNLLRIFTRLTRCGGDIREKETRKAAEDYFLERMQERPGDFNQALMDIGAAICLPGKAADCSRCPLSVYCLAHEAGEEADYPAVFQKAARRVVPLTVLRIRIGEKLCLNRRPDQGLLAGLYELPNVEGNLTTEEVRAYLEHTGAAGLIEQIEPLPDGKHVFTHLEWHMKGYEIRLKDSPQTAAYAAASGWSVVDSEALRKDFSVPAAFSAFLALD